MIEIVADRLAKPGEQHVGLAVAQALQLQISPYPPAVITSQPAEGVLVELHPLALMLAGILVGQRLQVGVLLMERQGAEIGPCHHGKGGSLHVPVCPVVGPVHIRGGRGGRI